MSLTPMERKLAAIMIADIASFSRLMERNESLTFTRLRRLREEITNPKLAEYGGRLIKSTGDGFLAEFPSATAALKCGIEIQRNVVSMESEQSDDSRIHLRIGINVGDIIVDGEDVAGDGVNIAARLEALSPLDGICISLAVREHIHDDLGVFFEDLGEQKLKNISRAIKALAVTLTRASSALNGFQVSAPVPGFRGRPAIAVLPFENMSNDPEQAYFADGIAEDILTRLAMWRWMPVIARNSSFVYRGKSIDLKKVGAELGAHYILEGSVRKAGDRVRITGQLIDTNNGHHVWAQRYDRILNDIFALQDEITEAIVAALEPAIGQAERGKAYQKGANLHAWDLYQRGAWHYGRLTRESVQEASKLYLAAAERDVEFALPLAGAATVKMVEAFFAWTNPIEAIGQAYRLASEARNRDPIDPLALAVLGFACAMVGQYDLAIEHTTKSIELNPSSALGHYARGYSRLVNGQPAEAIAGIETAMRLSPNDFLLPAFLGALSAAYYMKGDYGKCREVALFGIERAPHYPMNYRSLANALGQLGCIEEGNQALDKFIELAPGYSTEVAKRTMRFRHESEFEHYMAGLNKLGWNG